MYAKVFIMAEHEQSHRTLFYYLLHFFVEQRAYIIEIMSRGMGTALFLIALSSREEKTVKVTVGWTLMGTEVQK